MMHHKIKAAFGHSLTILWARAVAVAGFVLALVQSLAADPAVSDAIKSLLDPKLVPLYIIAIALITEIARWRTARPLPPIRGKDSAS